MITQLPCGSLQICLWSLVSKLSPSKKWRWPWILLKAGLLSRRSLIWLAEVHLRNIAPGSLANSELLHYILNELQVPVITMWAHHDEEALSEHVALGACSHVLKPLDTASLNMLKQKALEHKSKKATPQGPIPNRTKSRMVSSSTERLQEMLILEGNNLSNPGNSEFEVPEVEKAHGCSKLGRVTWTVELHEKFLDAIEVLGDKYATPERIRRLMNVKGLTWKHIGSHLQKHRLRKQNAKQGGQHQRNASTKLVPELIGSGQTAATTESITPRVDTDIREAYPSRMWKHVKQAAALKTYMCTHTSGISRDGTKSVWDEYQKGLQKEFSASNKRWQQIGLSSSKCQLPVKNNAVVIDGGVSSEAPKAAGEIGYGASVESSGSSSLSSSLVDQVGDNNHTEAAGKYDNMGNINLLEGTMNKDASDLLAFLLSDDLDLIGPSDSLEEQVSHLMSELEGSPEQQNLGLEDPLQVDNAWNKDLALPSLINIDGSMAKEVTFQNVPVGNAVTPIAQANGSSQDQQDLGLEDPLQVDNAGNKGLESPSLIKIDGSIAQEATVQNAPIHNPAMPVAKDDDGFWSWSPLAGDLDMPF